MNQKKQDTLVIPPVMAGPKLCHLCNKNRLNPKDKFYLPNGIEVCGAPQPKRKRR